MRHHPDLQWLTSWIANNFIADNIVSSLETNSIFLLALFSTVTVYSLQKNDIRVIDILVIHQFCLGFLFSIMSLWGYRTSKSPTATFPVDLQGFVTFLGFATG
jgi:hypothetical protein